MHGRSRAEWSALLTWSDRRHRPQAHRTEEMQTSRPARGPWHVLEMRRDEFRQDMNKHLGMVDAMLDGRNWILGEPSLADFGIYGSLSPLLTVGENIPKEFPRLAKWASMIETLGR